MLHDPDERCAYCDEKFYGSCTVVYLDHLPYHEWCRVILKKGPQDFMGFLDMRLGMRQGLD